jgi:hypothetical protein
VSAAQPFATDPDIVDRGTLGHHTTEEALASYVRSHRARTHESPPSPPCDLVWTEGTVWWIAEVKSTTPKNEEKQLRYGLGQLLRYANAFAPTPVRLVLVAENPVADPGWGATCAAVGVTLTWPGAFDLVLVTP